MPAQRTRRRLPEQDPADAAYVEGLKALGRRERTVAQIRARLAVRGHEQAPAEEAIGRLVSEGALDDDRYARCFAEDKRELAGWGEERITAALLESGVERGLAEAVASESYGDQVDRASGLLRQRGETLGDDGARNRALGFLTRRGFAYEVAYDAIRRDSDS